MSIVICVTQIPIKIYHPTKYPFAVNRITPLQRWTNVLYFYRRLILHVLYPINVIVHLCYFVENFFHSAYFEIHLYYRMYHNLFFYIAEKYSILWIHCIFLLHHCAIISFWWITGLFMLWVLWIKLLWTFLYKYLCGHMFSFVFIKC